MLPMPFTTTSTWRPRQHDGRRGSAISCSKGVTGYSSAKLWSPLMSDDMIATSLSRSNHALGHVCTARGPCFSQNSTIATHTSGFIELTAGGFVIEVAGVNHKNKNFLK